MHILNLNYHLKKMENNSEIKVNVNASEIISKLKNKVDRQNFYQEMIWFCPNEPGYDSNYFLKVIMGEKCYLPINFNVECKLKYFKKGIALDKKYIISKMLGNPAYALYTPDNINMEKLSRNFLLTLVAFIDPNLYRSFYSIYKQQMTDRKYNKWINYNIEIKSDILSKIQEFVPTNINNAGNKSFKLTKNHISNNTFKRIEQANINFQNNAQNNIINTQLKKENHISIDKNKSDANIKLKLINNKKEDLIKDITMKED